MAYFKSSMPFSNVELKFIMAYFKSSMPFSNEESKSIMVYLKWTSHFGWYTSYFGWSVVLTIHRHVHSFGPLSHRKTSHFGRFLKFYKKAQFTMAFFSNELCPSSNEASKCITAYFKSSMPFFERRIEIYNGLLEMDLPLWVIHLPLWVVWRAYDPRSRSVIQTPQSS